MNTIHSKAAHKTKPRLERNPLDLRDVDDHFRDRFWSKVEIGEPDECWLWTASRINGKYGQFYIRKGVPVPASRVALALQGHVLTTDEDACHSCDNPPCCNPFHLWVGNATENLNDCFRKGLGNRAKGSRHASAVLTESIVRELILNAPYSFREYREFGRKFGCTARSVAHAVRGITWKHVHEEIECLTTHSSR